MPGVNAIAGWVGRWLANAPAAVHAMGALMLGLVRELELPVDVVTYAPPTPAWTPPG